MRAVTEHRKAQLEKLLREEEQRFVEASKTAVLQLLFTLSPTKLIRKHPVEAVLLAVTAGILLGSALHHKSDKRTRADLELA